MDLGKYEVETYIVLVNGQSENRQRIIYSGNNDENFFIERYYGSIRSGYKGANTFFKNLSWTNIKSHIVGESIVINDNSSPQKPQIYFNISSIESIQRDGDNTLVVIDNQIEPITLEFISVFDKNQAYSLFNLILQDSNIDLNSIITDLTPPTIFFNEYFFSEEIKLDNPNLRQILTGPFSTEDGDIFRVDISLSLFGGPNPISKDDIISGLVYDITDNRDGGINLTTDDIIIYKDVISYNSIVDEISGVGTFICKFNLHDLGQNQNTSTIIFSIV
jgi:hypothetical protein